MSCNVKELCNLSIFFLKGAVCNFFTQLKHNSVINSYFPFLLSVNSVNTGTLKVMYALRKQVIGIS